MDQFKGDDDCYKFSYLEGKQFTSLTNKDAEDNLMKWSMKGRIFAQCYSFDEQFRSYKVNEFVKAFFEDSEVIATLNTVSDSSNVSVLRRKASSVEIDQVACTLTTMNLFNRLEEANIVRDSGHIKKCFDETFEDILISDELRKMLLIDDSDNYCLYGDEERNEFLFKIFQHVCLGGQVCQFEDLLSPYVDLTKAIYKDLVSVQKNPDSKELKITSYVYKVIASDEHGTFYPDIDPIHVNTFAYLVVDPYKRHVTVFYHNFGSGQF